MTRKRKHPHRKRRKRSGGHHRPSAARREEDTTPDEDEWSEPEGSSGGDDTGGDAAGDHPPARTRPAGPRPPMIRVGCNVLIVLGVLSIVVAFPVLLDPDGARCSIARDHIEDAVADDRLPADAGLAGRDPGDLDCEEALALAGRIPIDEDGEQLVRVRSEESIRLHSGLVVAVGAGQAVSGWLTARTLHRRARIAALVFSALGIVFAFVGFLSLAVSLFVIWALFYSRASQEIWGTGWRRPATEE